jgi:RNA polymerase sigma-70 factor (ECF subfamily)
MTPGTTTLHLQGCLDRLRGGDPAAREELLRHSQERLRKLTHRMLARFPGVHRFEQTDDVLQNVLLRLNKMLDQLEVTTVRDYLRLAAANIRRELIDLARHYYGPYGIGANQAPPPHTPDASGQVTRAEPAAASSGDALSLDDWTAFHEAAAQLPDDEREVFDLLWYHEFTQDEAAEVLGVSLSTLKRCWQTVRVQLMGRLGEKSLL